MIGDAGVGKTTIVMRLLNEAIINPVKIKL
jgi:GTPase SAR1 family protein